MTRVRLAALACCATFLALGASVLGYAGLQADEVLFSCPLFAPYAWAGRIRMFHHDLPIMVMNYIGTLKTLLYAIVFAIATPSATSVRIPMLLAGALTVWLVYRLIERTAGPRAALIVAALLATEPVLIMTTVYDWGPVALQHLLLAAGMLLLVRFHQDRRPAALFFGTFTLGLGLWDKVSFAWLLTALVIAGVATFHREIPRSPRLLVLAAVGLILGALPLVLFNYQHKGATFQVGTGIQSNEFEGKYQSFRDVLRGSGLYGYLASEDVPGQPGRASATPLEKLSATLHSLTGHRAGNLGAIALMAAAVFALLSRSRGLIFALLFVAISWTLMLLIKGAGGSVHHTILLWPGVSILVGLAIARAPKPAAAALATLLIAGNLVIFNEYLYAFTVNGSRAAWSDAIQPLAGALIARQPARVCLADWGMINQLRLLGQGRLQLDDVSFELLGPTPNDQALTQCLNDAVIVTHTEPLEEFKGARAKLDAFAARHSLNPTPPTTITDTHNRPVFHLYRYTQTSSR